MAFKGLMPAASSRDIGIFNGRSVWSKVLLAVEILTK